MLAVPSRVSQRLPHLTPHDVAEIDAEIRMVLNEIGSVADLSPQPRSQFIPE
jgi:phage terminase Nu1 subunit (DNA packaging protein)